MSEVEKADLILDIVVPVFIILALFAINGVIFAYIWRQRKHQDDYTINDDNYGRAPIAEHEVAIELEQL